MAKVRGVKEKLHMPLYDAFVVAPRSGATNFRDSMIDPRMIRFFVDVENKTKLDTNLQASGVLRGRNRFEARALRVVTSGLEPEELSDLIYNSVTTLPVGEKIMIEAPTYFFPSGAGISLGNRTVTNHAEPNPMATFRFAEPVTIEPQQNFRVEILFPEGLPQRLGEATGPLRLWVILDGYLTRNVQ
jgi:hypothetical protein